MLEEKIILCIIILTLLVVYRFVKPYRRILRLSLLLISGTLVTTVITLFIFTWDNFTIARIVTLLTACIYLTINGENGEFSKPFWVGLVLTIITWTIPLSIMGIDTLAQILTN